MHQTRIGFFITILAASALALTDTAAQDDKKQPRNQFEHDILVETFGYDESTPSTVEFRHMYQGCPARDCIPSIDDPEYVSADEAARFMRDANW